LERDSLLQVLSSVAALVIQANLSSERVCPDLGRL
jgi:hypothetical protein